LGYSLKLSKAAKEFIAEKGYDEQFGARPLKRAIQKYLEDKIAEEIIQKKINEGDSLEVEVNKAKDDVAIKVKKGSSPSASTESKEK